MNCSSVVTHATVLADSLPKICKQITVVFYGLAALAAAKPMYQ